MTAMIHREPPRSEPMKARVIRDDGEWLWWCDHSQCVFDGEGGIHVTHVDAINSATEHVRTHHRKQQPKNVVPFEVAFETLTREQAEDELASIRRRAAELSWLLEHNRGEDAES